jgi:hypothetical protein
MPKLAQYDSTVSGEAPVLGWYDTDRYTYANLPPEQNLLTISDAQWAARTTGQWAVAAGALMAYTPPAPPPPTLAQQAVAMIAAGLTITSTATPALNGTYGCDAAAQQNIGNMYNLIQRAGGNAFPGGLTSLPWADKSGTPHIFESVSDFLAFETAIGDFVLQCQLVAVTNAGTLPAATATIP